jgi:S1-C subfamily serine protease
VQLFSGLKTLGILLLGVSLGAIGTNWLSAKSDSSSYPITAETLSSSPSLQDRIARTLAATGDNVVDATVCVKTMMGQGEQACASGVSIDPQLAGIDRTRGAVVLTNYHVIADMGNRPPLQLGGKGEVFNAEILRQSPEFDLALLFVPDAEFPIAPLAETSPDQGTAVRAIGFPNNQPLTIKDSSLLGKTQHCLAVAPCLAIQQGTITFGNSGGPLEADGRVVGITQGETFDEVAIPVEQIRQFLSGETPPASRSPQFEPGFPPMQPMQPPMRQPMQPPPYYPHPMEGPPPYPVW